MTTESEFVVSNKVSLKYTLYFIIYPLVFSGASIPIVNVDSVISCDSQIGFFIEYSNHVYLYELHKNFSNRIKPTLTIGLGTS